MVGKNDEQEDAGKKTVASETDAPVRASKPRAPGQVRKPVDSAETHSKEKNAEDNNKSEDAVSMIKEDHRKIEALFRQYKEAGEDKERKQELVEHIVYEFLTHSRIEEVIFYPACEGKVDDALLEEAQVEHDGAKVIIAELRKGSPDDPYYDAKVTVLSEYVKHHVAEEEKTGIGILDAARKAGIDLAHLGQEIAQNREEIARLVERETNPPMPSLYDGKRENQKESKMAQQDYRERSRSSSRYDDDDRRGGRNTPPRDEEGRFMSEGRNGRGSYEDDDDYDRRHSSSRYDNDDHRGGRNTPPRDEEGRFVSEGRGGRSRYDDDDDRGGYSRSRSRYDDDDDRGGRSRNRGSGWYGDSEGHAEAARQGWDDRGRSSRGDDDYDRSRSGRSRSHYDDDRGGRRASSASDRERDEQGRFVSEGGGGRSGRSAYDDDDRGGSRRSSRSGYDDDDRDDRGHGGWFGDPRGHSDAARRGWANR